MKSLLYMAWRYLAHHRVKTVILIISMMLIVYIPVGLRVLIDQGERQLMTRAEATPLLVGARGSPLELALNSLYFTADVPETMAYGEVARVSATKLALPIPLYVRFRSRGDPIVGTTLDYFAFRTLEIESGGQMTRLGDCVLGAAVAGRRGLGPGDHIVSTTDNVFDLAGVYPLKMRITGVLAPADSPDDDAVFVDVKTAWIIEGLAHGHTDLARPEAVGGVLQREGNTITANASVVQYNEITDDNIDSFHFHGDVASYPITAIIAVPHDHRSATLLMGRFLAQDEPRQILQPTQVVDELLATILSVESFVIAALALVGVATLATAALVFLLSLRLRKRELETMFKIGGSRAAIGAIMATEIVSVFIAAMVLAAALTWLTGHFAAQAVRLFLL